MYSISYIRLITVAKGSFIRETTHSEQLELMPLMAMKVLPLQHKAIKAAHTKRLGVTTNIRGRDISAFYVATVTPELFRSGLRKASSITATLGVLKNVSGYCDGVWWLLHLAIC